ncbi:MAG: fumarylacetoacetase [Zetaproteobacteria bacterium]|nr:fumarylacetoacetase [Zetaproteobacteria bacterium]
MPQSILQLDSKHPYGVHNLPYGVFSIRDQAPHLCVAIGDYVCDLHQLSQSVDLGTEAWRFQQGSLSPILNQDKQTWSNIRKQLQNILAPNSSVVNAASDLSDRCFFKREDVVMHMPWQIGDYTDFYASIEHAKNVGSMFRDKDNPLLPNWRHLPVGYHGRASSIVISHTPIRRPRGQVIPPGAKAPQLCASQRLDFELELGCVIGGQSKLGQPITIEEAPQHIFGVVLVNDWSARDIQKWEYQPLGPFVSKSFATSISPWVVTMEALESFRCPGPTQEPMPLDYLRTPSTEQAQSHLDLSLSVSLQSQHMQQPQEIVSVNSKSLYWSFAQMITHHTITGCNLNPGDLIASGTISGTKQSAYGSMLELAWGGKHPLVLANQEQRSFLADGDTIEFTGYAENTDLRVGLGCCTGTISPALV